MLIKGVGIFSIIFIFIQYIVGLDFTFYTKLNPNTSGPDGFRYPSFFHDPQKYGQFIMILSFLYLPSNPKDISIKHVVPFLISICAMLLTGSRSALLGFGGGLVVLFIFLNTKIKILVGSLALIGSILFFFYSDLSVTLDRVSDFEHDYEFRSSVWKEAFEIFKKHPFLGIGSGNYQRFMEHYSTSQFFIYDNEIEFFDQPENGYLKILVEFGLFGFIIFLLFFLLPIIRSIPLSSNDTGGVTNYYFIAAIASWLIAFNSVYSIGDKRILLVLVCLLSLLVAYHKRNAAHEE
jgi:hypothetical protein